jgi:hypothetical protein
MLKHWNKLLNTDCTVVGIGHHTVYPIFRVGSSSLFASSDKKYTNHEIKDCKHIDILIRDPRDRFISGLLEYSRKNGLDIHNALLSVRAGKLIDRHFAPQYMWLLHLYKFYRGPVTLKSFEHIKTITNTHINKANTNRKEVTVPTPEQFLKVDYLLMQHYDKTMKLGDLIEENRHALS